MKRRKKRITLTDVAQKAGVSAPTASAILRRSPGNNSGFSQATYERVMKVAQELNYRPNRTVSNFYRKRHGAVGVLVPTMAFAPTQTMTALVRELPAHDLLMIPEDTGTKKDRIPTFIKEDAVDAIIAFGDLHETIAAEIARFELPVLYVNGNRRNENGTITYDERQGAFETVKHLQRKGYERVDFIDFPKGTWQHYSTIERWDGLCAASQELGLAEPRLIEIRSKPVSHLPAADQSGIIDELVQALKDSESNTGFYLNRNFATQLIVAIQQLGRGVPADHGIVAADTLKVEDNSIPSISITTIDQYGLGTQIAETVQCLIEGGIDSAKPVAMAMRLMERGTTAR